MDIFKDKSLDSQEAKAIEDYKPATHVDLKQLRNEIDGLRSQKRSLNEIRNTLEEKYDYQREETKQIIDAWRGSRPRIPTIKNPSEGKKAGKDFEDRVWRLFYNMGADYLNSHIKDFQFDLSEYEDLLPSKAQIDVLGIFKGRFIFICECTSSKKGSYEVLKNKVVKIESYKAAVKKRINKLFNKFKINGKEKPLQPIWIMATEGYDISPERKIQLLKNDLIVLSETEIEYLENCYESSESSEFVFNQFLGFFKGNSNYWGEIEVQGFTTSYGGLNSKTEVYTFSIKPTDMMRMSAVAHRKAKNIYETEGLRKGHYQRVLTKGRLKGVAEYIDDKKESFKNNIMVSYRGQPSNFKFNKPSRKRGQGRGGMVNIKVCPGNFHIIDGQHRLYGYSEVKDKTLLDNHELIVTAFVNLSEQEEAQIFIDVNSKQVKVKPDLIREVRALKGFTSRGKEKLENMATAVTAGLRDPLGSPFTTPSAIAETEPKKAMKLLTPLAFQNAIIESRMIGIRDHKDGLCSETSKSDEENYYLTIENTENLLLEYFTGVRNSVGKLWSLDNKKLNEEGVVYNPFIGALILLLGRFIETSNLHSIDNTFKRKKLDPYFNHLFNSLKNMTEEQKDLFFGDRSKFRTETGRRYILALLVKEFFLEKYPQLQSDNDKTYLKRLKDDENKNAELSKLRAEAKKLKEIIKKTKDLNINENKNNQAQYYEKIFKSYIHSFFERYKGEDYSNNWLRKQNNSHAKTVLSHIRERSDEALRTDGLNPYQIDISWCNFPELRGLLLANLKENNQRHVKYANELFGIVPYENSINGSNPKKEDYFVWMEFLNVMRRFNDSGHTAAKGDIDPTDTELSNNRFKYYDEELKKKISLIESRNLS